MYLFVYPNESIEINSFRIWKHDNHETDSANSKLT